MSHTENIYAVMGNPVRHSKSPAIHREFARQRAIALEYRAIHVELGGFESALRAFRENGGRGLNITVPFKLEAYQLADRHSARAEQAGAVNTLRFEDDGSAYGDNTDGVGLLRDITANLNHPLVDQRVLILGAGGAVRGILDALLEQQPKELVVANRTVAKAKDLEKLFRPQGSIRGCGFEDLRGKCFDVVINATAASLQGDVPAVPKDVLETNALAYDLMYGDKPTPFMIWAKGHGTTRTCDGLGMLVEQAAESFFVWHGVRPDTQPVIGSLRESVLEG